MMPELGMDMFDTHMPPVPDMPHMAPSLEWQPEPDAMMDVPQDVMEVPMPAEQPEEFVAEPGTEHIQTRPCIAGVSPVGYCQLAIVPVEQKTLICMRTCMCCRACRCHLRSNEC